MWAYGIGLLITYISLLLVPFWLVWPLGVLVSLYLVKIIQVRRHMEIKDEHILGVLLGAWCSTCYGMMVFLGRLEGLFVHLTNIIAIMN